MNPMDLDHPKPAYELSVDGQDITADLAGRLISLTLTDNRGFEADQIDLTLDDADGRLDLPPRGAKLTLALGWAGAALVDKGSYTVDEIEHCGAPDQLTLRARSADLRSGLTTAMERSFHGQTLGVIVRTIAAENGLEAVVSPALDGIDAGHVDQTNESSANLLTRLAGENDAIATVKSGKLLFVAAGLAHSAGGKPLPGVVIVRADGDRHRFNLAEREAYSAVKASYYDLHNGKKGEVIWRKAEDDAEAGRKPGAPKGNFYPRGDPQESKSAASALAKKEWKRLSQQTGFRAKWDGVTVEYDDSKAGFTGSATWGKADEAGTKPAAAPKDGSKLAGKTPKNALGRDAENVKVLRHVYATKANAKRAARAECRKLQRGVATFSIDLALGRPDLMPEMPAEVAGFKPAIDSTDWLLVKVTHRLSESGYTTAIELEIRATEIPD